MFLIVIIYLIYVHSYIIYLLKVFWEKPIFILGVPGDEGMAKSIDLGTPSWRLVEYIDFELNDIWQVPQCFSTQFFLQCIKQV